MKGVEGLLWYVLTLLCTNQNQVNPLILGILMPNGTHSYFAYRRDVKNFIRCITLKLLIRRDIKIIDSVETL